MHDAMMNSQRYNLALGLPTSYAGKSVISEIFIYAIILRLPASIFTALPIEDGSP